MRRQQVGRALPCDLESRDVPAPPSTHRAPCRRVPEEVGGGKPNERTHHIPLPTGLVLEFRPMEVVEEQREPLHPVRVDDSGPSGGVCRAQVDGDAAPLPNDGPHHEIAARSHLPRRRPPPPPESHPRAGAAPVATLAKVRTPAPALQRVAARTVRSVIEVGRRRRNQPAPPRVVFEALVLPYRDPTREWLKLAFDERPPEIVQSREPDLVVWSSLWGSRPDAVIRFELPLGAGGQGTDLTWTLLTDEPAPEPILIGHLRKRINTLINAELRYSFGQ